MEKFEFYYEELIGGNKYHEIVEAKDFRTARDKFFNEHQFAHRIDAIWNLTTGKKLK